MQTINYTQVSNEFIDSMAKYSGADVKVFFAISRKTIGWHKISDRISYSQLQKITGLSVNSLKTAIKILVQDKWIVQEKTRNGYSYDLNITISLFDTVEKGTLSKNDTLLPKTLSKNDTTKESIKEISTGEPDKPAPAHNKKCLTEEQIQSRNKVFLAFNSHYARIYKKKLSWDQKEKASVISLVKKYTVKEIDEKMGMLEQRCKTDGKFYCFLPSVLINQWNKLIDFEGVKHDEYLKKLEG